MALHIQVCPQVPGDRLTQANLAIAAHFRTLFNGPSSAGEVEKCAILRHKCACAHALRGAEVKFAFAYDYVPTCIVVECTAKANIASDGVMRATHLLHCPEVVEGGSSSVIADITVLFKLKEAGFCLIVPNGSAPQKQARVIRDLSCALVLDGSPLDDRLFARGGAVPFRRGGPGGEVG